MPCINCAGEKTFNKKCARLKKEVREKVFQFRTSINTDLHWSAFESTCNIHMPNEFIKDQCDYSECQMN